MQDQFLTEVYAEDLYQGDYEIALSESITFAQVSLRLVRNGNAHCAAHQCQFGWREDLLVPELHIFSPDDECAVR